MNSFNSSRVTPSAYTVKIISASNLSYIHVVQKRFAEL